MKIVTLGCSFTHKYTNKVDKVWAEIVAENLGSSYKNLAYSGRGNVFAFGELLEYLIMEGPPDKIYWLMTEWDRTDGHTGRRTLQAIDYDNVYQKKPENVYYELARRNKGNGDAGEREMRVSQVLARETPTQYLIDHNIMLMCRMQSLCKEFNIDLKIMQGLQPFVYSREWYNKKKIAKEIIFSKYNKLLDLNTIIGYPFVDISGGFCLLDKPDWYDYALARDDLHPSQKGHDYIADLFLGDVSPLP